MSEQTFTMVLRSVGNPDWGQYAPISEKETVTGSSLAEMRRACEAYIEKWDLGGGNWTNPVVKQGSKIVGHFSYNGRLWKGAKTPPLGVDREEILIPVPAGGVQ